MDDLDHLAVDIEPGLTKPSGKKLFKLATTLNEKYSDGDCQITIPNGGGAMGKHPFLDWCTSYYQIDSNHLDEMLKLAKKYGAKTSILPGQSGSHVRVRVRFWWPDENYREGMF